MKTFLLGLMLSCMYCYGVHAQDVEVHIKSDGVNLPFAYVYINGDFHVSADSTGTALIPHKLLREGDCVSAKYVGALETAQIYDGKDEIELNLPGLDIEAITILSNGKRKDFWRNINKNKIRKAYQKISCRFHIHKNDDSTMITRGRAEYHIRPLADECGYEVVGNEFDIDNKANLGQAALNILKHIVNDAFVIVGFKKGVSSNKGIQIIKEEGAADNQNIYTILRPAILLDDTDKRSVKIYVDAGTNNITQAIVDSESKTFNMLYSVDYFVENGYYIPNNIECKIVFNGSGAFRTLCLHIYDLHLDTKRD